MDSAILDFFETYVLPGRATDAATATAERQVTGEDGLDMALEPEGMLYDLIQQVHAVHCRARRESGPGSSHISQAVQIWHELDNWDPDVRASTPDHCRLYRSYQSAIFIWAYLIIHPDDVDSWKVQDALRDILVDAAAVDRRELVPFLVIPLFLGGLTAVSRGDQEFFNEQYERVCKDVASATFGNWGSIVRARWAEYKNRRRPSWDWI